MLTSLLVSAYDFGYFVKLLTAESLPTTEEQFFTLLQTWFPTVYDVKFLMRSTKVLRGTLQELADDLGVCCSRLFSWRESSCMLQIQRIGINQTGSDSLLTASTFFKIRQLYFNDRIDDAEYNGKLYGFGPTFTVSNGLTDPGRGGATIAEREDRGSVSSTTRDGQSQSQTGPGTPVQGVVNHNHAQIGMGPMQGVVPAGLSYGMGGNGPYLRTGLVGGR